MHLLILPLLPPPAPSPSADGLHLSLLRIGERLDDFELVGNWARVRSAGSFSPGSGRSAGSWR